MGNIKQRLVRLERGAGDDTRPLTTTEIILAVGDPAQMGRIGRRLNQPQNMELKRAIFDLPKGHR